MVSLHVFMNGLLVGKLNKGKAGELSFQYADSWLQKPNVRPISLSLALTAKPFTEDLVYNFFDNLLPDNSNIRVRIQKRFQTSTAEPFDLLQKIGRDCVGAIQLSESATPPDFRHIDAKPLSNKKIADLLLNYQNAPLGMEKDLAEFRISIAGAQEKTALLKLDKRWCIPLGATPTSHIFKLPIGQVHGMDLSDSCENEWLCSEIAAAFALPVANSKIQTFNNVKALVVERFDRKLSEDGSWLMRLPQEDMCQALGVSPHLKYQSDGGPGIQDIMNLLLGATDPIADRDLFFKYQILFWLLAAIDGHAKNFSIFIEAGGQFRLTPLYDVMSAFPLIAKRQLEKQKIKMAMALKSKNNHYKWIEMHRRYFLATADLANFPPKRADQILDSMLVQVDDVIKTVRKKLPENFPTHISNPIFKGMLEAKQKLI